MPKHYVQRPVGRAELQALTTLAKAEEAAFFERNPHLVRPYRNRLIAVALCQGAALQYLRRGYGVNDFDVHFFYSQNPRQPKLTRAGKRMHSNVGRFKNMPVDFLRSRAGQAQSRENSWTSCDTRGIPATNTDSQRTTSCREGGRRVMPRAIFGSSFGNQPADSWLTRRCRYSTVDARARRSSTPEGWSRESSQRGHREPSRSSPTCGPPSLASECSHHCE
jgi:hypothetical protein